MRQFAINGKYLTWDYCPAIIERNEDGKTSVYSYVAPVYADPNGCFYDYPDNSDYDGDDDSWRDEPVLWWLFLNEADEPIEFASEEEAKKEMVKEFLKKFTFVKNHDYNIEFDWYETEEDRVAREAEEAKKAKELEEAKQAFINSWKEEERDFFKSQLRNCDWDDNDARVNRVRAGIEREYEDWHERNPRIKTWSEFLDAENVIGYLWGSL